MKKKGSLNLSTEAIVTLILAIVMLSLALVFVRNMFTKITGQVDKAVEFGDLTVKPTAADPFVINPDKITIARGKSNTVQFGFYNMDDKEYLVKMDPDDKCTGPTGAPLTVTSTSLRKAAAGNGLGWDVSFYIEPTQQAGIYHCEPQIYLGPAPGTAQSYYGDLYITVE